MDSVCTVAINESFIYIRAAKCMTLLVSIPLKCLLLWYLHRKTIRFYRGWGKSENGFEIRYFSFTKQSSKDPEFDSIEFLYAMCPRKPHNRRHNIHITVSSFFYSVFPCAVFITLTSNSHLPMKFHRQAWYFWPDFLKKVEYLFRELNFYNGRFPHLYTFFL